MKTRNAGLVKPVRVLALFALALALSLARAGDARADEPKNLYMVSVGITNAIGQPVLQATKKDALDMAKWGRAQRGKLFGQANVTAITNEQATGKRVLGALSGLESKAKAGDYVIFYVSSHGGRGTKGEFFFCAYDGNVFWDQIATALGKVPGTKIVILDTCFAGAASSNGNLIVLAACQADQFSHDGSSAGGNSIYTQYLLEGLYGKADANRNGIVSLAEAAGYASAKLRHVYQSKPAKDQQFSVLSRPKGVAADLPLARLGAAASSTTSGSSLGAWAGTENLAGYGKLRFTLKAGGQAVMTDAKSTVPGTWTRSGAQLTLAFPQVGATYRGTVSGSELFGQARNRNGVTWRFRVSKAS